jgi:uncharacterized protein
VGPPVSIDEHRDPCAVELQTGVLPRRTLGTLDAYAAPTDPRALDPRGDDVREVEVTGPLGALPTWWFPAPRPTWAIVLHGRSGATQGGVPAGAAAARLGPADRGRLVPQRPGGPPSPDGRSHLGATEWEDVEAAVAWAREQGARDVVLIGMSMGGACIGELLARSPLAGHVRALVLDAPVLDWGPVIRRAAVERGLPLGGAAAAAAPDDGAGRAPQQQVDWDGLRTSTTPRATTGPPC